MRIFCSICKDIFIPYSEVVVTNCGHLYHNICLSTWIGQHKTCPQCRCNLTKPLRVFFDVDKDNAADASTLEHELETVSYNFREAERQKKSLQEDKKQLEEIIEGMKECAITLSKKNDVLKISIKALKEQVANLTNKTEVIPELESEIKVWKAKVNTFEKVDTLIKGSVEEVNKMMERTPVSSLAVKQLCTYVGVLKLQLDKLEDKNCRLSKENKDLHKKVSEEKMKYACDSEEVKNLKSSKSKLEKELCSLKILFKDYKKRNPEKNKEETSDSSEISQVQNPSQKPLFDLDVDVLDDENKAVGYKTPAQSKRPTNHWEELVCAAPSKSYLYNFPGFKHKKIFINQKEDKDVTRDEESYAFDGLGGRKKLRLGGPTPQEEFERIKKNKDRRPAPAVPHKKIIDYCYLNVK